MINNDFEIKGKLKEIIFTQWEEYNNDNSQYAQGYKDALRNIAEEMDIDL